MPDIPAAQTPKERRRSGGFLSGFANRRLRWRHSMRIVGLALLAALLGIRAWDPAPVETLRLKTLDTYQVLHPRAVTAQPVTIVDIDERSLAEFGQWPWPRTALAALTKRICDAGAVAVGFDIVFAEPDRLSPARYGRGQSGLDPAVKEALARAPDNDAVFAEALAAYPTVLGRFPRSRNEAGVSVDLPGTSIASLGADPKPHLAKFAGAVANIPILERNAAGVGMLVPTQDSDNIIRRVPSLLRIGDSVQPSLALEILRVATGQKTFVVRANEAGVAAISIAGNDIPTDREGRLWVHYARDHAASLYVPAVEIMAGRTDLKGRLVIVGTSAAGLRDIVATPIRRAMPGVEVHAQLLESILSGSHLERPYDALGAELVALLLIGLAIVYLIPRNGAWRTLAVGGLICTVLVAAVSYLYAERQLLFDLSYPLLASLVLFAALAFMNYIREQSDRRQIRAAFSRYLAPAVVNRLSDNPAELRLGGEMRNMTLLFSDVQGFTGIAENCDAVGLTRLVNAILTPITNEILRTGGTVDKYMGDAVMAFWNAPVDDPDHAKNACRAALAIQESKAALNETLRQAADAEGRGFNPVNFGVGVNTGECCVGNMGSDLRFDYSVLGDAVNLASRLEGQTRTYGVGIVVGEETRMLANGLAFLELDEIRVKGKTVPVRIFALLGEEDLAGSAAFGRLESAHGRLLAAYRRMDWNAASAAAKEAADGANETGLALAALYGMYEARISEFAASPPPEDWDGVYVATTKG